MATLSVETVYQVRAAFDAIHSGNHEARGGSFTITGGEVEIYESNEETKPIPSPSVSDSMVLIGSAGVGSHAYGQPARWLAFKVLSGTPVIEEFLLIQAGA